MVSDIGDGKKSWRPFIVGDTVTKLILSPLWWLTIILQSFTKFLQIRWRQIAWSKYFHILNSTQSVCSSVVTYTEKPFWLIRQWVLTLSRLDSWEMTLIHFGEFFIKITVIFIQKIENNSWFVHTYFEFSH